jgi:hypothetical protein
MDCSRGGLCRTHPRIPDWGIAGTVAPETDEKVVIQLTEEDKWGSDDHVDLVRGSSKDLTFYVGYYSGRPYIHYGGSWLRCPKVSEVSLPRYLCRIYSQGDRGDKARIQVSVQFPRAPTP